METARDLPCHSAGPPSISRTVETLATSKSIAESRGNQLLIITAFPIAQASLILFVNSDVVLMRKSNCTMQFWFGVDTSFNERIQVTSAVPC